MSLDVLLLLFQCLFPLSLLLDCILTLLLLQLGLDSGPLLLVLHLVLNIVPHRVHPEIGAFLTQFLLVVLSQLMGVAVLALEYRAFVLASGQRHVASVSLHVRID